MADPGFAVDHVVIQTPDREAVTRAIAQAAGLAVLQGYSMSGVVQSTGVRFANGPFLDIFATPQPGTALILAGEVDEAERLAKAQDWAVRPVRREQRPPDEPAFPWSMALFRRGQDLLTRVSIIEYSSDPEDWADPDFAGALYKADPQAVARLSRVWLAAQDPARAERDLAALGYVRSGEARSAHWPHHGLRLSGPAADLVICEGEAAVVRLDIETPAGGPAEIVLPEAPRLVVNEPN